MLILGVKKVITSFTGATRPQFPSGGNKNVHFDRHIHGKAELVFFACNVKIRSGS